MRIVNYSGIGNGVVTAAFFAKIDVNDRERERTLFCVCGFPSEGTETNAFYEARDFLQLYVGRSEAGAWDHGHKR